MNINSFVLPIISLVMGLSPFTPIPIPVEPGTDSTVEIDFDPIGGLDAYCDDVTLVGHLTSRKVYLELSERVSVALTGQQFIYYHTNQAHLVTVNKVYDITFNLPLKAYLSKAGINIKVEALDELGNTLVSYLFHLNAAPRDHIRVDDYTTKYYVTTNVIIDPDKNRLLNKESFYFSSFMNYFNEDYYYRINLDGLKMTYSCFLPFPGCQAKLIYIDYDRVFPNLDNNDPIPVAEIPLQVTQNKTQISFNFPQNMYVNPQTLEMSMVAKPDYILTHNFYLPINRKHSLIDEIFTLTVTGFGYSKASFSYDIYYENTRGLVGDCDNSDYCVVGEMN